jgi:hypothetical protein
LGIKSKSSQLPEIKQDPFSSPYNLRRLGSGHKVAADLGCAVRECVK